MTPDRRWDDDTRRTISLRGFTYRVYLILAALVVLQFATGFASVYLLLFNVPEQARHFAVEINAQRARNVLDACNDSNSRHDATVQRLDQLIAGVPAAQRGRAQQSRAATVLLIDSLAPKHDCRKLVATQVQGPGSTTQP